MKALVDRHNLFMTIAVLTLALLASGWSIAAEELTNDSRHTAVAVRITFMINVMIWDHGDEFDTVEPSSGLSSVFVFSGGEVRRRQSFEVEWSPDVPIKSVEWLEVYGEDQQKEMELVRTCSCVLSPGDDLQSRIDQAYDGMEICLEPGTYTLEDYTAIISVDLRIRGLGGSPSECQLTCPNYSYLRFVACQDGALRLENMSFAIPKYSWGKIDADDSAQCYLQHVEVLGGSNFEIGADGQTTMEIADCLVFSILAREQSQITASETRFDGDLGTEYGFRGVSAYQEAQITLSNSTISHFRYALNMEQESHLTMTNCSVTDIEREFFDCDDFTGSIQGTGNSIDAPLEGCSDLLPSGFLNEGLSADSSEQQVGTEETPLALCTLSPSDSLLDCLQSAIGDIEISLEPGIYKLEGAMLDKDVTLRGLGTTPEDVRITGPEYDFSAAMSMVGTGLLTIENVTFDLSLITLANDSQLISHNASLHKVFGYARSTMEITDSTVTGGIYPMDDSRVIARTTAFIKGEDAAARGIMSEDHTWISVTQCVFSGWHFGCQFHDADHVEIWDSVFSEDMEFSIVLGRSFAGELLGARNAIESELRVDFEGYEWPDGFFAE